MSQKTGRAPALLYLDRELKTRFVMVCAEKHINAPIKYLEELVEDIMIKYIQKEGKK